MQFFSKISLIDNVGVEHEGDEVTVTVNTIALGQFRSEPLPPRGDSAAAGLSTNRVDEMHSRWTHNGVLEEQLDGQFSFSGPREKLSGEWRVSVSFVSDEIRYDPQKLLVSDESFRVD
jgi:hypothetical protein